MSSTEDSGVAVRAKPLPRPRSLSLNAARNIRALRKARGWTLERLSEECAKHGAAHLTVPALNNLDRIQNPDSGRKTRVVSIDDLYAFAAVFSVPPDSLVNGPSCETCMDQPPAGFACLSCGTKGETS